MIAHGLSFVFARNGGDYRPLFLIGSAAMVAALALDLATGRSWRDSGQGPGPPPTGFRAALRRGKPAGPAGRSLCVFHQ
jgi:hypothetical protein